MREVAGALPWSEADGNRPCLRVLIADDSPFHRRALADLVMADASLELVGTAGDVAEAASIAGVERPDVAVVDVRMPGGGGPRVARAIRRRSPDTRVVALSASEDRRTVMEMLRAGTDAFVVNGVPGEEVLHAIHHVGRGHSRLVPEVVRELARGLEVRRRRSERDQRRAERIRRLIRGEDLSVVFQPIADLRDGRVIAVEALARIATPPIRPPDRWLAEARTVGLDVELELTAIRAALACFPRLPAGVDLAVNASPRTIVSPRLAGALRGVPPERLVIEVTEHTPVEDPAALQEAAAGLRARGMRLAIDDAGAGFSSLGNILRITPDLIKLDISLVRGVEHREADRATAAAVARFAADIGARLVAEGIETRAELLALRALGVHFGQGFYLARPAPLPDGRVPTEIELEAGA
jgi:EAL domain-containing protein (putative c-di-GMP-specific phosphodiesterase class I)/AmiR/NasT family two-component response regulator